jgi:hypothetical protein
MEDYYRNIHFNLYFKENQLKLIDNNLKKYFNLTCLKHY